jgi:hypothetical protein
MGLNEKRKAKEIQDTVLPGRAKEIQEITGTTIPYEVDWDSFDTFDALNFMDNCSCHRLNMALRVICQDDLGKGAVKDGLRKIKLKNVKDKDSMKLSFEGGVLEMHNDYAHQNYYSDNQIRQLLVDKL